MKRYKKKIADRYDASGLGEAQFEPGTDRDYEPMEDVFNGVIRKTLRRRKTKCFYWKSLLSKLDRILRKFL